LNTNSQIWDYARRRRPDRVLAAVVGGLLALPLFALPTILAGAPVSRGLVRTALLGIAGFVLYAIFGVIVLRADRPLAAIGRAAQRV